MTKTFDVKYCGECPFNHYSAIKYRGVCRKIVEWDSPKREITYNNIPSWCPLPDKERKE